MPCIIYKASAPFRFEAWCFREAIADFSNFFSRHSLSNLWAIAIVLSILPTGELF